MDKAALENLLASLVRSGATTLHLIAGHKPCMRSAEELVRCNGPEMTNTSLEDLAGEFLFDDQRQRLARGEEVHVLYSSQDCVRFRTVVTRQAQGLAMMFRRIPNKVPTIAELKLPALSSSFVEFGSGLVLLTGFLGSGKSWTLAALVDHVNRSSQQHIVTIESPVEFIHESAKSIVHQREVGFHVDSFAGGVRDACRHDARLIMVSDIRDYETLDACLDAAEKGFLVLTTLCASSVVTGLTELMALCDADERPRMRLRLSAVLRVMMSQALLQKANNEGRVPMIEILINNQAVGQAIRAGQFHELPAIMQKGRGLGMQTTDMALRTLFLREAITREEALYHAIDRDSVVARAGTPVARDPR